MKTLVIHPEDSSTRFLSDIYSDKDWTILTKNVSKRKLKEQIESHDRIVMLGHGTENGLFGFGKYVIDPTFVYLLREKVCVCIWCNADVFVKKYKLHGFYTGMIISDYEEAVMYCISTNSYWINESNIEFANAIKNSIDLPNMLEMATSLYEGNTAVIEFNRNNLYYVQ